MIKRCSSIDLILHPWNSQILAKYVYTYEVYIYFFTSEFILMLILIQSKLFNYLSLSFLSFVYYSITKYSSSSNTWLTCTSHYDITAQARPSFDATSLHVDVWESVLLIVVVGTWSIAKRLSLLRMRKVEDLSRVVGLKLSSDRRKVKGVHWGEVVL